MGVVLPPPDFFQGVPMTTKRFCPRCLILAIFMAPVGAVIFYQLGAQGRREVAMECSTPTFTGVFHELIPTTQGAVAGRDRFEQSTTRP